MSSRIAAAQRAGVAASAVSGAGDAPDWPAGVWRAAGLPLAEETTLSTGEPALDAVLPGGGWPVGALTELLQPQPHAHLWRLLAPGLAQALARQAGPVVLVAPPRTPFVPGLAALGLPAERWLWVNAETPAARLWATEQALRCAEVAAVLAWLPQAGAADLRRLQLAAQRYRQLLFVMRPCAAQSQASPARLRLMVEEGAAQADVSGLAQRERGGEGVAQDLEAFGSVRSARGTAPPLRVHVLKRRGPPLVSPVLLPAQPPLLGRLLRSRRREAFGVDVLATPYAVVGGPAASLVPVAAPATRMPRVPATSPVSSLTHPERHGLDRAASRA